MGLCIRSAASWPSNPPVLPLAIRFNIISHHDSIHADTEAGVFAEEFHPQPGSNGQCIITLSDCTLTIVFTLFVVNIPLPAGGLSLIVSQ